jgi:hypothetical protein
MIPSRRTALIAGLWFAGTFVFSIPAGLLYDPILTDAGFILGTGDDTRVELGALLEILLAVSGIATAVVFYPVLKRQNQAVALGYVAARTVESIIIMVGVAALLSVVVLRHDVGGPGASDPATLEIAGRSLVTFHEWTRILGPQFCAGFGNGILLGSLMYMSGLLPRRMALLGLIGGPLAVGGGTLVVLGVIELESGSAPLFLLTALEALWEASLTIWLIVKGFRPSPIAAAYDRDVAEAEALRRPRTSPTAA